MIVHDVGTSRFNFRVVGVLVEGEYVLLHRATYENFWSLPGGRAEVLETTDQTLRREMREELGVDVEVGRLLWVAESFFTFQGIDFHELGLYFEMHVPADWPYQDKTRIYPRRDNGYELIFRWMRRDALANEPILPGFLRDGLRRLPETTVHIVDRSSNLDLLPLLD